MAIKFPNWPKSKEGCERQINAILNSYRRDFAAEADLVSTG